MSAFYYAILTACIWGMVPVIEKIGLGRVAPCVGLFYRGFGVILGMSMLGIFYAMSGVSLKADIKSIGFLAVGGLLASFVGQFFFYKALKLGEASTVVPVAATYPLVSFIIGVVVLQERVTLGKMFGIALIIAGIFFLKGK